MTLTDLHPKLTETGFLVFDCPVCWKDLDHAHRIRVPLSPGVDARGQSWQHSGEFPDTLTLTPSVDAGCWHGHIRNGQILPA